MAEQREGTGGRFGQSGVRVERGLRAGRSVYKRDIALRATAFGGGPWRSMRVLLGVACVCVQGRRGVKL